MYMVKEVQKKGVTLYLCEECDFYYKDRTKAQSCEDWDKVHHTCNIEIIKDAIDIELIKSEEPQE